MTRSSVTIAWVDTDPGFVLGSADDPLPGGDAPSGPAPSYARQTQSPGVVAVGIAHGAVTLEHLRDSVEKAASEI